MDVGKVIEEINNSASQMNDGYTVGLGTAIRIIKSHQEDKVVLPKYVAEDWEDRLKANNNSFYLAFSDIVSGYHASIETYRWINDDENLKVFLQGFLYGYTVEKEKKYRVPLKGLRGYNGIQYLSSTKTEAWFACARALNIKQEFTEEELKSAPEWVQNLPREEVEDDE